MSVTASELASRGRSVPAMPGVNGTTTTRGPRVTTGHSEASRIHGSQAGSAPAYATAGGGTPEAVNDEHARNARDQRRIARRVARAARRQDPYYDRVSDAGTVVVAATAGVASWAGLVLLGEHAGMGAIGPIRISWLIALCVDILALISLRAWINTAATWDYRKWGRGVSVAALAVSIIGNALGHVLDHRQDWILTATVAALPPLALFAALHLRVLRTQSRREAAERAAERERKRQERETARHGRTATTAGKPPASVADVGNAVSNSQDRAERPESKPRQRQQATKTRHGKKTEQVWQYVEQVRAAEGRTPTTKEIADATAVPRRTVTYALSRFDEKQASGNDDRESSPEATATTQQT